MSNFAQQLCTRLDQLKSARANYESHWSECYKFGAPERQQCFSSSVVDNSKTQQQQRADLYDSTAADSVQVLVSMIMNGVTPSNAIWFKAQPGSWRHTPFRNC